MLASALVAALAWAPAQEPPLAERLGLEGPLDNDTDLVRNAEALALLLAGDKAIEQRIDETTQVDAFEHWRRALIVSDPLDAVAVDERRSIAVAQAVENRLGSVLKRAFRERFEGVAAAALAAAGANEQALTRVAHEHPFTPSGYLAELRLCDSALERGATATARAALNRLRARLGPDDAAVMEAVQARARELPEPIEPHDSVKPFFSGRKLVFERSIDLKDGRSEPDAMLEPGFAGDRDGRVWIQTGERLVALLSDGKHAQFEPSKLALEARAGAAWLPGFGDKDRAWLQRPAIEGSTLTVVLGRARETRGNALAAFDITTETPRLVWIHHDEERGAAALLPGRLEYQPGPVAQDGLVIAQVLQWDQGDVNADQQRVDGRNTHAWLFAIDARDGSVAWKRRLASGADRRSRALDRFDQPRSTSVACLPLERYGESEIAACTELGALARVSALDGRWVEGYATKRVRHDPEIRPGSGGPFVADGFSVVVAPADADEFVYALGKLPPRTIRIPHLDRLLGTRGPLLYALVGLDERSVLERVELPAGERTRSLPLQRGAEWKGGAVRGSRILIAAGRSLLLYQESLKLEFELELAGLENESRVGVWTHGSKVYVAGQARIWVVRVE